MEEKYKILQDFGIEYIWHYRPPINIEIPGGYTEEILKAVESMKTAEIVI